jgi:lysophospholipase L1-like esterase
MGEDAVKALHPRDHTHFNPEGADLHARFVVQGLKELPTQPVAGLLSDAGESLEASRSRAPRVGPVHAGFNPQLPTLWLIGDSTVKNSWDRGDDGLWGWGNPIAAYFDQSRINVENQALGGTSSRSFLTTRLWEAVRVQIQPGDFVIMQFGHNDGGGAYEDSRARKSIKGSDDETVKVTLQESGLPETVHTFGWYLRQYVSDIKARGATPIICSLVPRNNWRDGKVIRAEDSYAKWAREAAAACGALFIDLNGLVADRYDRMGEDAVKPFFPVEHTHTGWEGAVANAECIVQGIRSLNECELKNYLLANPAPPKEP